MSLTPEWRIGDLSLTDWPFAVPFGADYGTPDFSPESLASFLTDGDLELTARAGNRTLTLPVWIEDTDLAALAEAEAALVAECDKPINALYVDPGDGFGEPFEFTVFRGQVTFQRDDDREQAGYRLFQVAWRGLPWPESTTEIAATLSATSVGSGSQRYGTFDVRGSVNSRGSLSVEHASTNLGEVLLYTAPTGSNVPACNKYRIAGLPARGSGSGTISGGFDALNGSGPNTSVSYDIPHTELPSGEYLLMARCRSNTSPKVLSFTVSTYVSGNLVASDFIAGASSFSVPVTSTGVFPLYSIAMVHLPAVDLAVDSAGVTRITAQSQTAGPGLEVDEVYLFNLSGGRLSFFNCGGGIPPSIGLNKRLWVDSPSVDNEGRGRYLMGNAADRSDAYSALVNPEARPSIHEFPASGTFVFAAASATGGSAPGITYKYRPAGHSSVYSGD